MNVMPPPVILFSRDTKLRDRIQPLFTELMEFQICDSYLEFSRWLDQTGPCVVLLDIRLPEDAPEIDHILRDFPDQVFIALGKPHSAPMLHPAVCGMYSAMDPETTPSVLAGRVEQAQQYLQLLEENRFLKREVVTAKTRPRPEPPRRESGGMFSTREWIRIVRCMNNVDVLQERLLEELSTSMQLSRAGIVLRTHGEAPYLIRAGWMLAPNAKSIQFQPNDPFVRWCEKHAHLVSRSGIDQLSSIQDQAMLVRVLDKLGAEMIVPLRGRDGLLGWFFTGHPLTGNPFDPETTDQLILAADLMAVSLESALLHQEVSLQKALAETLINALPVGIIYSDERGLIRWCSPVANFLLGSKEQDHTGKNLHSLGPHIHEAANMLFKTAQSGPVIRDWQDPVNGRPLRVTAIPIANQQHYSGILMTLEDRTSENQIKDKQDRLDRGLFWNQLAASMSHEVRNPLVAIKTFAQLLPERYEDPEFRAEFSDLVGKEINRLNAMIDQLNHFAHPQELNLIDLDVCQAIQFAWVHLQKFPPDDHPLPEMHEEIEPCLPEVKADLNALSECVGHLLRNAVEALSGKKGRIRISIYTDTDLELGRTVNIRISDDGPGVPPELKDQVFSPFCTQKARGLGLGLSIAHRTMADHNGKLELTSNPRGTTVVLILPVTQPGEGS
ncbi:MAG: ATP-binding protein [Kiritimatiellia bacterium]